MVSLTGVPRQEIECCMQHKRCIAFMSHVTPFPFRSITFGSVHPAVSVYTHYPKWKRHSPRYSRHRICLSIMQDSFPGSLAHILLVIPAAPLSRDPFSVEVGSSRSKWIPAQRRCRDDGGRGILLQCRNLRLMNYNRVWATAAG